MLWSYIYSCQAASPCYLSEVFCAFASKDMISTSAVVGQEVPEGLQQEATMVSNTEATLERNRTGRRPPLQDPRWLPDLHLPPV